MQLEIKCDGPTKGDLIKRHLVDKGHITSLEAINLYNVTRLAAYIHILRDRGWNISAETVTGVNKFGSYHYARYHYHSETMAGDE